jgi:hypothetical protein
MRREISAIVLAAGIAVSLTACVSDNAAYSELSRDRVATDALPDGIGLYDPSTDSTLLVDTSRLIGTSSGVEYYLVLSEQPILKRDDRPSARRSFHDSRGRTGVCIVMFAKANGGQWGIGCGDGSGSEMGMGGTWARYVPPGHGDDEGPDVPRGWVRLSDNMIVSE